MKNMQKTNLNQKQGGQVALIVLIVSAVVLTLGLSTSKRTVTENKITTEEGLLKEAFNVAESGIEYYLSTGNTAYSDVGSSGMAYVVPRNLTSDATNIMEYNEETLRNNVTSFWMVAHNSSTNEIEWNNGSNYPGGEDIRVCVNNNFVGGLLVNYFYTTDALRINYGVRRLAYNVNSSGYENFLTPDGNNDSCGTGRRLVGTISTQVGSVPILVTIKPMGSSARVAVGGSQALPIQGEEISSTGVVGGQQTGVKKIIRMQRRYELPQFMLDAVSTELDVTATN